VTDQAQKLRELARSGAFAPMGARTAEAPSPAAANVVNRCRSVAVTSGKGGVGKTNIALSLAVTLAGMKKRVLLLDADFGLANVHILLGVAPRFNLAHAVRGECDIGQVIWKGPNGIDLLPGASGIEAMANIDETGLARVRRMLGVLENGYDFMVIDTAAGISTSVTHMVWNADLPLLVMTPEPTSLADAYSMAKVLFEHGVGRIAVIVNMATSDREGAETFDRLAALVVRFLKKQVVLYGTLPFDRDVSRYVKRQQLLVLEDAGGKFAGKTTTAAWKIAGLASGEKTGFFARLWKNAGKRSTN
jgi:flagellar biosynthesis protein FlhG